MKKSKTKSIPTCYVLFSGGLDSRLALKIMQEHQVNTSLDKADKDIENKLSQKSDNKHIDNIKFKIIALTFKFPFGSGCCQPDCSFKFTQTQGIEHKIIDCAQGKLFKKYLEIVAKPKFGHGSGINPCIDCRIFILNEAKKLLRKGSQDFIVTGEVLGERPMSQHKKAMLTIDKETELSGKILRPLSAKLLEITEPEKNKLIDREKLFNISGRSRKPQIALANHYKISYPHPAGGCLLCEQVFKERLKDLLKRKPIKDITLTDINLLRIGRHFFFSGYKTIVGRNHEENLMLKQLKTKRDRLYELISLPGPSVLLQGKINEESVEKAKEFVLKYSKNKEEVVEK